MNIQEYISSGIVESYVLGLASDEERHEFEKLCAEYPELSQARTQFELAIEKQSMDNAISPPRELKTALFSRLGLDKKIQLAPVRKMQSGPGWLKYAVAASVILLAASLYWNYTLRNQNSRLENELSSVRQDAKMIQDNPALKMARLDGMPISPASFATVYWDTTTTDVYLMINNLPQPASHEQYQLWALLNGEPVDMGVLQITEKPLQLYRMKNVKQAEAFAITLEKKGGNPKPTMDKLYVMGKL